FLQPHHDPHDLPSFPNDALPIYLHPRTGTEQSSAARHSGRDTKAALVREPRMICDSEGIATEGTGLTARASLALTVAMMVTRHRSEEHTSELQSRENLVCRLLLE